MKKLFLGILCLLPGALPGCAFFQRATSPVERQQAAGGMRLGVVLNVHEFYGQRGGNIQEVGLLEITVLLDSGEEVLVQREADDFFKKGDRVRLLAGPGGQSRIQHE